MSLAQYDPWDEHFYETEKFKYTYNQFSSLRVTTLATSIISLMSSSMIMMAYTYMFIYHRKEANRVSLRCVFLCCLADALNAIWNLVIVGVQGGTAFCQAASILIEFSNVLNASLLTLVGINLFLIFVINVNRRDLLEKFYYPSVVVYALVAESVSIYTETISQSQNEEYSCWYQIYIADRTEDTFGWMWFYGFIFFVNVIAIFCSVAAMIKLIREQKALAEKMNDIAISSSLSNIHADENMDTSIKKRHSYVFSTVVVRCIVYPLVPFLVNIFGFILQLVLTTQEYPPGYAFSMLDVVFSNIGGFFVALVFFTDPAITSVMKAAYDGWRKKYVDEYTLVPRKDVEKFTKVTADHTAPCTRSHSHESTTLSLYAQEEQRKEIRCPIFIQSPSPALISQADRYSGSNSNLYNSYGPVENRNTSNDINQQHAKRNGGKLIPMRRLLIQTAFKKENRRRSSSMLGSISTITPAITRSSQIPELQNIASKDVKEIYIPYRFPHLATCAHALLGAFGATKRSVTSIRNTYTKRKASNETSYSSQDEEDIPYIKIDDTDITPITEEISLYNSARGGRRENSNHSRDTTYSQSTL